MQMITLNNELSGVALYVPIDAVPSEGAARPSGWCFLGGEGSQVVESASLPEDAIYFFNALEQTNSAVTANVFSEEKS